MRATVLVRPKEEILDPQGEAVEHSLRTLGFPVTRARVGRLVEVEVDAESPDEARKAVDAMCRRLLANPLVETYEVLLAPRSEARVGTAARNGDGQGNV